MFVNADLQEHLETSSVVKGSSLILAEWNMNISSNIAKIGNYRYRPNSTEYPEYNSIAQSFSFNDSINRYYTGATDADVLVDGGLDDQEVPSAFISKKEKEKMLFSLEDCFGRFRPRSGINKLIWFENSYSHFSNQDMARRPRYYVSDKLDKFKYWRSFRTENNVEFGVANINLNNQFYIYDAAPFVVYENSVPANRVVVKMQTHVGDLNLGNFLQDGATIADPFFGFQNQKTPIRWKIQSLNSDRHWYDLIAFDENSARYDGSPIIGPDGYVEINYGLIIPESYRETFQLEANYTSSDLLPDPLLLPDGTSYLVRANEEDPGTIYLVKNDSSQTQGFFTSFPAEYGWSLVEEEIFAPYSIKDLTSPSYFTDSSNGQRVYREFEYLYGLRLVVETMNVFDSALELIELSPRLNADISDKVSSFDVTKTASDLGVTGLPVGQLLASIGSVEIFDNDQAFFDQNPNSLVSNYTSQNIQLKFYEIIKEVKGKNYYVPIKTMYSEGFPIVSNKQRSVSLTLRDLYFYLESITAPQILIQDASLSYAVSLLLDYVGFSNYSFLRNLNEEEEVIPYFYVEPDMTIADVLFDIARSTQSCMFFDEYNNFIVMSKNYLMPSLDERPTDIVLRGSNDFGKEGVLQNKQTNTRLSNILDVSFKQNEIFNGGSIQYTTRSIQRAYSSIRQATLTDRDRSWIYKPSLLWEVTGSENTKSVNEEGGSQSAYVLSAIPLNSNLSSELPYVQNNQIVNNVMDFGDGIYWIARYNGFFYSSGEVIKYDAVQYSIPGLSNADRQDPNVENNNVWITSLEDYQKYFSKIPFNGKMYPTGLVRIYTEPDYETVEGATRLKDGPINKHGRGQFGTPVVDHFSGISSHWTSDESLIGCRMDSRFIFNNDILRFSYLNVPIVSNETNAVLKVADASLASAGDYVVDSSPKEDGISIAVIRNYIQPETQIVETNISNNTITLSNEISGLSSNSSNFKALITETSSSVVSNDPVAVLQVGDASLYEEYFYIKNLESEAGQENDVILSNTKITSIDTENNQITLSEAISSPSGNSINFLAGPIAFDSLDLFIRPPKTQIGKAGLDSNVSANSKRSDLIKNIFTTTYTEETAKTRSYPPSLQASALVFKGNCSNTIEKPADFISTVYKKLDDRFVHFGTRMRIIGRIENNETRGQSPEGGSNYYVTQNTATGQAPSISGGSGGLAFLLNPETNNGYYFEIAALTENNLDEYSADGSIFNVFLYKIKRNENATDDSVKAIPERLYGGLAQINVDDGLFVGQGRLANEESPTVYDIAAEYEDLDDARRIYLYINGQNVAIVDDNDPLPAYQNVGLFVRGNAKVMFENVYALTENYSQNSVFSLSTPVQSVFGDADITANEAFQKYAISGLIQNTYLSGIGPNEPPKYKIFFEEFGSIMREAAYFNIRYDKAYPALAAQIAPTFNKVRGYTVSNFIASSYGAEFLVFNNTDTALSLDSSSGNYLRIQGVTFTQDSTHDLTVDDFYDKRSSLSDPERTLDSFVISPVDAKKDYEDIKLSRITHGQKDFTIDGSYIQTQDSANNMMRWLSDKIMKPRKSVGLSIFPLPTLQLGDIVTIDYNGNNNFSELSDPETRFVVYSITYGKNNQGPTMEVYLSEVN